MIWWLICLLIKSLILYYWNMLKYVEPYIEIWFIDQKSNLLEIEDKINITLVINQFVKYKK